MCSSAVVSVSVCARCLTALVRDSSFECTPCVQRRSVCLLKVRERKGRGKGGGEGEGEEECCSVW